MFLVFTADHIQLIVIEDGFNQPLAIIRTDDAAGSCVGDWEEVYLQDALQRIQCWVRGNSSLTIMDVGSIAAALCIRGENLFHLFSPF